MATPNELYAMEPERVERDISHLTGFYYNHIPEVGESVPYGTTSDRIEIRFLKDWCFDGRRVWQLATVWFEGKPVMVTQNAGREGDDHSERFVTDADGLMAMCSHIKQLIQIEGGRPTVVGADEQVAGLTEFYGNKLEGHFERY